MEMVDKRSKRGPAVYRRERRLWPACRPLGKSKLLVRSCSRCTRRRSLFTGILGLRDRTFDEVLTAIAAFSMLQQLHGEAYLAPCRRLIGDINSCGMADRTVDL
jgi:hypothetical protein